MHKIVYLVTKCIESIASDDSNKVVLDGKIAQDSAAKLSKTAVIK